MWCIVISLFASDCDLVLFASMISWPIRKKESTVQHSEERERQAVLPDLAQLRENGASEPPSRAFSKCLRALRERPKVWRILRNVKILLNNSIFFNHFLKIFLKINFCTPSETSKNAIKILTYKTGAFLQFSRAFWRNPSGSTAIGCPLEGFREGYLLREKSA